MSKLRVLIVAGGSGGHLFPAQQLGELLKGEAEVAFAGHRLSESSFFQREKAVFVEIAAAPLGKGFWRESWRGFWQAVRWIQKFRPEVVVGFGSFHSFPVLLAAVLLRKKLVLFEANCAMGRVNRFFRPFAKTVLGQFEPVVQGLEPVAKPQFQHKSALFGRFSSSVRSLPYSGMPPPSAQKSAEKSSNLCKKASFATGSLVPLLPWRELESVSREEARGYFGLTPKRLTLLVFGGSQGATFLNELMPKVCALLSREVQVIHLSGKGAVSYSVPCCVKSFEWEMGKAYAAADVAICRAGAGTMAELIRFQLPALLIPFPHATENHQTKNGKFFVERVGGGRLLSQKEAEVERVVREIEQLLEKREEHRQKLREYFEKSRERVRAEEVVCGVGSD